MRIKSLNINKKKKLPIIKVVGILYLPEFFKEGAATDTSLSMAPPLFFKRRAMAEVIVKRIRSEVEAGAIFRMLMLCMCCFTT